MDSPSGHKRVGLNVATKQPQQLGHKACPWFSGTWPGMVRV